MLWLANSYAEAARILCDELTEDRFSQRYESTRVILHLCRHAAELYFKGAIGVKRADMPMNTHRLDRLYAEYRQLYPDDRDHFDLPFHSQVIEPDDDLYPGTLDAYQKTHDQRFRYPTDSSGKPFSETESFDILNYQEAVHEFQYSLHWMVARIYYGWTRE